MNLRFTFFLLLSFLTHILVIFLYSQFSRFFFIQAVYVDILETEDSQQKSLQIVDQPQFNHQTPEEDFYLSEHNNYTANEQKSKLGTSLNPSHFSSESGENEVSLSFKTSSFLFGNIDHLEDVEEEGFFNRLNTKEVLFYTFYSRIKHQIYWHWEKALMSELEEVKHLRGQHFMTRVEASFNSKGYLNSIIIREKSGLGELDRASLKAIQRAQPFPHPPEQLISKTGSFKLNYTFVLLNDEM